jgi:hypothetical protein
VYETAPVKKYPDHWQKTKVDVFALLFNIDNIPDPIIFRNNLPLRKCEQEADDARTTGIGRNTIPCKGHDDPRSRGDGLKKPGPYL